MKTSFSKRAVAVILLVMMIVTMIPMMAISASAVDGTTVTTRGELVNALKTGDNIILGADIETSSMALGYYTVSKNTTLHGNGHKITAMGKHQSVFKVANNVVFSVENVVFDGNDKAYSAIAPNFTSGNTPNATINLKDCIVENFSSSGTGSNCIPAVYYFSNTKGTLENCIFRNNIITSSEYAADIFCGGASDVTIIGGQYEDVLVNGPAAEVDISDNALVNNLYNAGPATMTTITDAIVNDTLYVNGVADTTAKIVISGKSGTYDTIENAIEAATDGDVVKCVDATYVVTANKVTTSKNITLDGFTFAPTAKERNAYLLLTGTDVAVRNCTFDGVFYNAIETTQSTDTPLNSLVVKGCTFGPGKNNSVNVFSFVDGAKVKVNNNTFKCADDCEAIRISNYTNAQNVSIKINNNIYNASGETEDDAFILFQSVKGETFENVKVAITDLTNTNNRPIYFTYSNASGAVTTETEEIDITLDGVAVDLKKPVVIGDVIYDSLEDALEAAVDGDTIKCVNSTYVVTANQVTTSKNITLDGFTFAPTAKERNAYLLLTGTDVAVKNCTFGGVFYNAIETTQSKDTPLNSLVVDGCTFGPGINNSVNVFSFVDGATVAVNNNTFNCADDCEAIRISNYTNAQNVSITADNNSYKPKNGSVITQWDAFILFQDTTDDSTTDFSGINVAVTNLKTTSKNPLYTTCNKACADTTATVKTAVTLNEKAVDLRTVQGQVKLENGMVVVEVTVGSKVGSIELTPAQFADYDEDHTITVDGKDVTFTMNDYIDALTNEKAVTALQAFEVYAKACAKVFDNQGDTVSSTYDFSNIDPTPDRSNGDSSIFCGVSINCSEKTELIFYADGIAPDTDADIFIGEGYSQVHLGTIKTIEVPGAESVHSAICVPVNSINDVYKVKIGDEYIRYSVKKATKLLSGVAGYETLAAALANYGDALEDYTAG